MSPACGPNTYQINLWRDLRLPMSALATAAGKSFNGKFTAKVNFSIGYFLLPLLMLTSEVCSLSIHYLISVWTTCWCNLNKIVWSKLYVQNVELFDKKKKKKKKSLTIFTKC